MPTTMENHTATSLHHLSFTRQPNKNTKQPIFHQRTYPKSNTSVRTKPNENGIKHSRIGPNQAPLGRNGIRIMVHKTCGTWESIFGYPKSPTTLRNLSNQWRSQQTPTSKQTDDSEIKQLPPKTIQQTRMQTKPDVPHELYYNFRFFKFGAPYRQYTSKTISVLCCSKTNLCVVDLGDVTWKKRRWLVLWKGWEESCGGPGLQSLEMSDWVWRLRFTFV